MTPAAALNALTSGRLGSLWREFCELWMAGKVYRYGWPAGTPLQPILFELSIQQ
jgi:hypothetical protein